MGRHSDPDPRWFWLSLAAAAAKAALGVAVLGVAVFGVLRLLDSPGDGQTDVAANATATTESEPAEPGLESLPAEPEESPEPAPTAFRPAEEDAEDEDGGDDAPVRGTVQVLNASGDAGVLADAIETLEELGYQVVAEGRAARGYERTTVFWSAGFRDEAESLQEADDRFAVIQRNDRLDATINLHVVVGRDWVAAG